MSISKPARNYLLARLSSIFVLVVLAVLFALMIAMLPSFSGDFHDFYSAGQLMLQGKSPYSWPRYYSPIWVAGSVAPLTVLPEHLAYTVFTLASLVAITLTVWRLTQGKSQVMALATMALLWVLQILGSNIDWVILAAMVVPSPLGVWLALSKPQLGWILAAVLLLTMPRRKAIGTAMALVAGLGLSYLIGMRVPDLDTVRLWNMAPWPWGLLAGIPMGIIALVKRDRALAVGSSLLVSPYWQYPSFVAAWPVTLRARLAWLLWMVVMILKFIEKVEAVLGQ